MADLATITGQLWAADGAGLTYRCLVAHGAAYQGAWGPPLASVWAVA